MANGDKSENYLHKDLIVVLKNLNKEILIPTYKFASRWRIRVLTYKEVCNIWGYEDLVKSEISEETIKTLALV